MISSPRRLQAHLEIEDFSCERLHLARVSGRGRIVELGSAPELLLEKGPPRVAAKPSSVAIALNHGI